MDHQYNWENSPSEVPENEGMKTLAEVSQILGIVSVSLLVSASLGVIPALLALIFGAVSRKRLSLGTVWHRKAVCGMVMGIVMLALMGPAFLLSLAIVLGG